MVTQKFEAPPDLQELVKTWHLLPPDLKAAIIAIANLIAHQKI